MLTPREIVFKLSKIIIGQYKAKKMLAIAIRNRWRRLQIKNYNTKIIKPKNILMKGSTGVGKTELAKCLAKIVNAPFIRVEITKFTEVGYVGKDVESIIKDLLDLTIKKMKNEELKKNKNKLKINVENKILSILIKLFKNDKFLCNKYNIDLKNLKSSILNKLSNKLLDNLKIEIETNDKIDNIEIITPLNIDDLNDKIKSIFSNINSKLDNKKKKVTIKEAFKIFNEEEILNIIDINKISKNAIKNVEENGIVFLDEIDKIASNKNSNINNNDVSRIGVQRDLLPIIDGTIINTNYGIINTNHILFISSGSFYLNKISDLLPELQGRFPLKVDLDNLSEDDYYSILTETKNNLIEQYKLLFKTENTELFFTEMSIKKIAKITFLLNKKIENIGARRLYSVMEELLCEMSFSCGEKLNEKFIINSKYVDKIFYYLKNIDKNNTINNCIL